MRHIISFNSGTVAPSLFTLLQTYQMEVKSEWNAELVSGHCFAPIKQGLQSRPSKGFDRVLRSRSRCTMRLSSFLAVFRPALPLILGLSLGCSLSLLMVSWTQGDTEETCSDELGNGGLFAGGHMGEPLDSQAGGDGNEDFQPRIVPYHKDPNKPHKKVLRWVVCTVGLNT